MCGEYILMFLLILYKLYSSPNIVGGYKIKKNKMGGACSAYGGGEGRVQVFNGETFGKENNGETQA